MSDMRAPQLTYLSSTIGTTASLSEQQIPQQLIFFVRQLGTYFLCRMGAQTLPRTVTNDFLN